jgi:hypothetical protein
MRIRVGDLVKKRLIICGDFKVFAVCLVTSNQVLVSNNSVGVEVEHLFLEGEPQEINGLLSSLGHESEEDFIKYCNTKPWIYRSGRSKIMKVLS